MLHSLAALFVIGFVVFLGIAVYESVTKKDLKIPQYFGYDKEDIKGYSFQSAYVMAAGGCLFVASLLVNLS